MSAVKIPMEVITVEQARQKAREAFARTALTWEQLSDMYWCECGLHVDYDLVNTRQVANALDQLDSLFFLIGEPKPEPGSDQPAWLGPHTTTETEDTP